jgi:hypothetical protein
MRTPEAAKLIRSSYFRENVLQGNLSISEEHANSVTSSGIAPSPSSPPITADPIQADLYFESAAGYGKWRILCSGQCLSGLARDGAQSDPVLKRLEYVHMTSLRVRLTKKNVYSHRELSMGSFSETNQKRLTRDSPVEIYRARLPGSVRLVVSRCFRSLNIDNPDASTSIRLMSSTSLEKTYVDILYKTVTYTEHSSDSMRPKVLSPNFSLSRHVELILK